MKRLAFFAPIILLPFFLALVQPQQKSAEVDRSPRSVAVSSNGRYVVTANTTADTVSLVDIQAGKVVAEVAVGRKPFEVVFTDNDTSAVVSNQFGDSLTFLSVKPTGLTVAATLAIGDEPRGLAVAPNGKTLYVALSGESGLASIDLAKRTILKKVAVGREPWYVGVSPDGKKVVVGASRSESAVVLDATTLEENYSIKLRGHNVRQIAFTPDSKWAYLPNIAERGRPVTKENIDQGWIVGNRLCRVPLTEDDAREAITLDTRGKAVGDVEGIATSKDGNTIVLTAAGTHELLVLRLPLPFVSFGGPGDHIEPELRNNPQKFRRIPVGGRPLGVKMLKDDKTVLVANYLLNALQIVNIETGAIEKTIPIGGPSTPSQVRQGEAIFYDAMRSFNQWYSCSTCHTEGHTNGSNFDTMNDGSYETLKKTLSLRGVAKTAPYTWHGHQKSLRQLVLDSALKSMQGTMPTEAELDALTAYISSIDFKPNPQRKPGATLGANITRGEAVFKQKGCDTCHQSPHYTSSGVYTVGLESPEDAFKGFNPPALIGLYNRSPYLHTGNVYSLETLITTHHRPSKLSNKPDCTPEELKDLVAFLKSL